MQIRLWYTGFSGCATQQNLINGSDKKTGSGAVAAAVHILAALPAPLVLMAQLAPPHQDYRTYFRAAFPVRLLLT